MTPDRTIELYKKKIIIDYYDAKHLYVVRQDGHVPISVTAVTGSLDKPALKFWAVGLTKNYLIKLVERKVPITKELIIDASKLHQKHTKNASTIGSMVHDWAEAYIKGQKPAMPTNQKVLNGVTAFLKWIDEHDVRFLASEKIVYSKKYDYVGTMDTIFTLGVEKHKIKHPGDFKTSNAVYPEMRFQVAAYQEADTEEAGTVYGEKWLIRFGKENGNFDPHPYPVEEHKKDFAAFVGLLTTKRRLIEIDKKEKNHAK